MGSKALKSVIDLPRVVDIVLNDLVRTLEEQRLIWAHLVKHHLLNRALARPPKAKQQNFRFHRYILIILEVFFLVFVEA